MITTPITRALLVQLVERRSPKPDVGGSSPPGRALKSIQCRKTTFCFYLKPVFWLLFSQKSQKISGRLVVEVAAQYLLMRYLKTALTEAWELGFSGQTPALPQGSN